MITSETIGSNIARIRRDRGVTQETLARELGVSWPTISRLERGITKRISTDRLHDVAAALDVSVGDFLAEDAA